jgi:hypothetical protein
MASQNISQVQGGSSTSTQDVSNEQSGPKPTTVAPAALLSPQSIRETSTDASPSQKVANTPQVDWESKLHASPFWLLISSSNNSCEELGLLTLMSFKCREQHTKKTVTMVEHSNIRLWQQTTKHQ